MEKMNVLFFIETLNCGGAEKSLVSLLQLLDYNKVNVDLLLLGDGGLYRDYIPKEVNIRLFPKPSPLRGMWRKICMSAFSIYIRRPKAAKRHGAETRWMFEHSALPKLPGHYDVAIAYQQGLPTYYVATKVDASKKFAWINTDLKSAGYRETFNRKHYDRYDGIVAVSDKLYQDLKRCEYMDSSRLATIYDILNVDLIKQMSSAKIESVSSSSNNTLNLVTVGRMTTAKNYPLAVETARLLRQRGMDFCWTLVGGGTELPLIKKMICEYGLEDCMITVGEQSNPYPYMRMADIYVHTASFEGYGLTIAEAKILGKPVVSTNFSVIYDQITDGVNGLIAQMTPESVADCIMRLASDSVLLQKITDAVKAETNTTALTEVRKFYSLIGL